MGGGRGQSRNIVALSQKHLCLSPPKSLIFFNLATQNRAHIEVHIKKESSCAHALQTLFLSQLSNVDRWL